VAAHVFYLELELLLCALLGSLPPDISFWPPARLHVAILP
jgi:hypothetical protein